MEKLTINATKDVLWYFESDYLCYSWSYYILQIIQEDKGSACYAFRKWGRVGNNKIGGTKLEEMSKSDAIQEFKRLFLEKTGNTWESWEAKENFEKQPGRFFPLEIVCLGFMQFLLNLDMINF